MSGAPDDLPHKLRKFDWYRTAMLINEDRASTADGWGKLPLHVALGNRQVTPIAIIRDLVLVSLGSANSSCIFSSDSRLHTCPWYGHLRHTQPG